MKPCSLFEGFDYDHSRVLQMRMRQMNQQECPFSYARMRRLFCLKKMFTRLITIEQQSRVNQNLPGRRSEQLYI